jgi:hypothetical protein
MKITGTVSKANNILVPVEIRIDAFELEGSADFLIDTGSTMSFINESTAQKIGLDYSKLLYMDTSTGIGGQAELYQINGFTRLSFESEGQRKEVPRKNFLVMKHNFCEHVLPDAQRKVLALEGILGMDMIKGWKLAITRSSYTLEI